MKGRLFDIVAGLIAGLLIGWGSGAVCYDKHLRAVQDYAKAASDSSRIEVQVYRAQADSQRHKADSLTKVRQPVIIVARRDSETAARLDSSLVAQKTAADSNVILLAENESLKQSNLNLWQALQQSDQIIALERARGDSLNKVLGDVNLRLQSLASQIEGLKPPPKWIRVSFEVVKDIALVRAGYEYCKHNCR